MRTAVQHTGNERPVTPAFCLFLSLIKGVLYCPDLMDDISLWSPWFEGRIQCCGSGRFTPDTNFFHPRSRVKNIPDPGSGSASKHLSTYLTPKTLFLNSRKYDPGCSSRVQRSKKHRIPDPQHLKNQRRHSFTEGRNGGSGHIVQVEEEGVEAVPVIRHHHLLVSGALVPQQQLCPEKKRRHLISSVNKGGSSVEQ